MKKLKVSGLVLLMFSVLSYSCTKETVRNDDNVSYVSSLAGIQKSTNTFGSDYLNGLQYLHIYQEQIFDNSQYCPLEFLDSGQRIFDSNTKLKNRIIHYYDSIGYEVDPVLYDQFLIDVDEYEYQDLPQLGASVEEIRYMDEVNELFSEVSRLTDLRDSISDVKTRIDNDRNLSSDASFRLLSSIDIFQSILAYGISEGISDIQDLDENIILSLPCGVAVALYAAAFVGLCGATGGILVAAAVIGFGGTVWGVFDNC